MRTKKPNPLTLVIAGVIAFALGLNGEAIKAHAAVGLLEALPAKAINKGGSVLRYEDSELRIYTHRDHGFFYSKKAADGQWVDALTGEVI